MKFLKYRSECQDAGVEAITFIGNKKNRAVVLRGRSIEIAESHESDLDFELACQKALRRFVDVRLGWELHNHEMEVGIG